MIAPTWTIGSQQFSIRIGGDRDFLAGIDDRTINRNTCLDVVQANDLDGRLVGLLQALDRYLAGIDGHLTVKNSFNVCVGIHIQRADQDSGRIFSKGSAGKHAALFYFQCEESLVHARGIDSVQITDEVNVDR